jgi:UDP-N-acetylmuramyl pentapeptide phosphotransferase/UDP-N-acetylglucosamine-1-phosphate transferase
VRWQRRNYRDRDVTLLLGPAVAAGSLVGLAGAGPRPRLAGLALVGTAAAVGAYDDLYGDRHARGLGGHLRALREGRVTTGLVKLVTLAGAAGLASGAQRRTALDIALGTTLIAGSANLVNLFDLRPGRAAKVVALAGLALGRVGDPSARSVAGVATGAALAALPVDLRERAMLGDSGAGVLGATLGWSLATRRSRWSRGLAAAAITGLTLASERVSFSAVIDSKPVLRRLDQLGRFGAVPPAGTGT